jgi:hypothetical protein
VATAANLGGLGAGALISGMLAQWAPHPLIVPHVVFVAALAAGVMLVSRVPETREPVRPRPRYRPQRVSVPVESRGRFFAAAAASMVTFALFGLLTSLAPRFVADTLHHSSRALAGVPAFLVFVSAALSQILAASRAANELVCWAVPVLLSGLGLLTVAVWLSNPSLSLFLVGVLVAGSGCGLLFSGALRTVTLLAAPEQRAEALAGLFLAGYLGLAGPVIGLGLLTQTLSPRMSLLVFAALLALGVVLSAPRLLGRARPQLAIRPETAQ